LEQDIDAPILLWLQGGPGASSMMALFLEHGPYVVRSDLTLKTRPFAWTDKYSVLYLDNPVGTGFSYTDNRTECYAHTVDDSVHGVYTFLRAFFTAFDHLQGHELILTGESYGGKYVPALANYIVQHSADSKQYFDFKGLAVGNGWIDPINQMNLSALLYQIGMVDDVQRDNLTTVQNNVADLINKGDLERRCESLSLKTSNFQLCS
jgi:vitellogenic carboxypeptidase-like protein